LDLGQRLADLLAHLGPDARGAQEVAVQYAAGIGVQLDDGADEAAAFELPEGASDYAEDEEEEDDVAESMK
jgi:hypothetical protein